MERISLDGFISEEKFQQNYKRVKADVFNHPLIRQFVQAHANELTEDLLERNLGVLFEYLNQMKHCSVCQSFAGCENIVQGFEPQLTFQFGAPHIIYEACPKRKQHEDQSKLRQLVRSMHVPEDILHASMQQLDLNEPGKKKAIEAVLSVLEEADETRKFKGFYLSGSFGIGKTYLLGVLANELAKKGFSSLLVYFPEFIREMKSSLQDQSLERKLEVVKTAEVLMIDDIGAESVSSFTRDEILGTILQFRMLEKLPTFFTSNFNMKEIEQHLSVTHRGDEEFVKAKRIIERIRSLTTPIEISGKNWRDK